MFPTLPKKWYEYEYPREAPKTFYVEYSNDRAAKFEQAKKAMEEGKEVRINGIPPKNSNGSADNTDGGNGWARNRNYGEVDSKGELWGRK